MSTTRRHSQITAAGSKIHVVEAGPPSAQPYVFLHGWPQSWLSWSKILDLASDEVHAIALDLPGIGESTRGPGNATAESVADTVHSLTQTMGLKDPVLVGHDFGGMATYAYLRKYTDLAAAVIVDVALPGLPPWDSVVSNPHLWHFGFHSIPGVPEMLVQGHQFAYFSYFFDAISAAPSAIGEADRHSYADAYASNTSLSSGLDWYRAFPENVRDNTRTAAGPKTTTPLLYARGAAGYSGTEPYVQGLRDAGVENVASALIEGSGHFVPDENPAGLWAAIREHAGR